jgi:P-type conjugative transfer protein TrbJ
MHSKYLWVARGVLTLTLSGPGGLAPAYAVVAVIDGANLTQTIVSATENVAQTLKQIEQYRTQLQQYENMLQNTMAPTAYVWDQAVTTMNRLRGAIDTLNYYKTQTGSLDAYLGKFQDVAYYRSSPCFSVGCSKAEWETMNRNAVQLGSEAQKRANDAMFRGLDRQQEAIEGDARQLERLQSGAQGVNGQMQAIGFANQLASQQANQLLQIRALLIAQQNAEATRAQTIADQEARTRAADEEALKGKYIPSPRKEY